MFHLVQKQQWNIIKHSVQTDNHCAVKAVFVSGNCIKKLYKTHFLFFQYNGNCCCFQQMYNVIFMQAHILSGFTSQVRWPAPSQELHRVHVTKNLQEKSLFSEQWRLLLASLPEPGVVGRQQCVLKPAFSPFVFCSGPLPLEIYTLMVQEMDCSFSLFPLPLSICCATDLKLQGFFF